MGRILRKRRVGSEDTENFIVGKSGVVGLKTGSSLKSPTRMVLMDKTNALKPKDRVRQKVGAAAPQSKDANNSSLMTNNGENIGKITRRRRSSKENVREPSNCPHDENEPRPLGDKTNVAEPAKSLDVKSKDRERAIAKELTSGGRASNRPPRNAAKFKEGWISALRSSRTSKENDVESQKPVSKSVTIPSESNEPSPPKPSNRARRAAKNAKGRKCDAESKENLTSSDKQSLTNQQKVRQDSGSKQQIPGRSSSESDNSLLASHDEESTYQQPTPSPVRKLPPRNAAKFEKGWIASLRRSRNSKENDGEAQKSPDKAKPLDDRTNAAEGVEKASSGADVKTGKENAKSPRSVKCKKLAEEGAIDAEDEKDAFPEIQEGAERRVGRRKIRQAISAEVKEKNVPADPSKSGEAGASAAGCKHRGLKDFESRITAKLGIDMSASVTIAKPKNAAKSPKKPAEETSSRRLRKRGVDNKIKTYAEADGSEDEAEGKSPTRHGRKTPGKSPIRTTVPHNVETRELKDIKSSAAPSGVSDKQAPPASVSPKQKDLGVGSKCTAKSEEGTANDLRPATSNSTLHEPKPGCSWHPDTTPLRKSGASKIPQSTKKSPLVAPTSSLFSIFKKPENPRRSSLENKIFVSSAKPCLAGSTDKKQLPVYGNPDMSPLKRTSALPHDKKEELYDFEVDENEPKPKKKHKPIMKIQRVRPMKRKKPKVYEADPETERRVLRNLDLSPSVLEEFRSAKKQKVENAAGVVAARPSQSPHPTEPANTDDHPDAEVSDHHDFDLAIEPMSSPCRDYGQSTPMRSDAPSMFMNDSRDKFGRLSAKVYSPVKSKDSPIPVLMAEYNNDPVRMGDSSRRSVVSNASCASGASGHSVYRDDLDVSASTPVRFNKNDSMYRSRQMPEPVELNLSNCFGFDEPEQMEEPLVSPIKSTGHVPATAAPPVRPLPILKSKPPVMLPPPEAPAVDVDQVIKQLRFEVGNDSSANNSADISVYDDSEITLKHKSPIKRYFQPKDDQKNKANKSTDESTLGEGNDSFSPIKVAPKVPRLSYERPSKLRKKKVVEPIYKETSEHGSDGDTEESDVEHEPEHAEDIFKPTKNKAKKEAPKKKEKGMTKKEEEELEKWAQMFNSQCNQIDSLSLVVE